MDKFLELKTELPKLYNNLKKASFLNNQSFSPSFINEAGDLKDYLLHTKKQCDIFDKSIPDDKNQLHYIESIKNEFAKRLDLSFKRIWDIAQAFSKEEYSKHQLYIQKELALLFAVSPYNKRVYNKPFGYMGDYIMMLYLYQNRLEGDSTYAKLIHAYSVNIPAAVANRNRKQFCKKYIKNTLSRIDSPKITSIASGPIVEIIETFKEEPLTYNAQFTCVDFDANAIEYAKQQIEILETENNKKININFINENILSLLKGGTASQLIPNQDFIYSLGLIDYLTNKISSRLIENIYEFIKKDGILIVGNVYEGNPTRAFIEMLGEWYINHRDENEMRTLARNVSNAKSINIEYEETTKMNIFAVINK